MVRYHVPLIKTIILYSIPNSCLSSEDILIRLKFLLFPAIINKYLLTMCMIFN